MTFSAIINTIFFTLYWD